jgi:hypothetical protein
MNVWAKRKKNLVHNGEFYVNDWQVFNCACEILKQLRNSFFKAINFEI